MSQITFEITAAAVAWYAAVVGTLSMIISAFNAWRDRRRLLVSARGNMMQLGDPEDKSYIAVSIVNAGRRPITVTAVALSMRDADLAAADSMRQPVELTEGRSHTFMMDQTAFEKKYTFADVRHVFAVDTTGKVWKGELRWSIANEEDADST